MKTTRRTNIILAIILGITLCVLGFNGYLAMQNKRLMEAVVSNDTEAVQNLLRSGANSNAYRLYTDGNSSRVYALSEAIQSGVDVRIVEALLAHGANINPPHSYLPSPLERALAAKRADILGLLLEKGARDNESSLKVIRQSAASLECYRMLRRYGYPSTLIEACHAGDCDDVKAFLDGGANINQMNDFGETPLYIAIKSSHDDVVKLLISRGVDVNQTGQYGSPFYVTLLNLRNQLPPELRYLRNLLQPETPIAAPATRPRPISGPTAAFLAPVMISGGAAPTNFKPAPATLAKSQAILALLQAKGAHLNLSESILGQDVQGVRNRIHEGVNVNFIPQDYLVASVRSDLVRPNPRRAALYLAIGTHNSEIVRLLLDAGANVNLLTETNQTPLMVAISAGNQEIVQLLLAKGADVHARSTRGDTMLKLARRSGKAELTALLRQAGAEE